jgi:hypothetical protein
VSLVNSRREFPLATFACVLVFAARTLCAADVLVPAGSVWKYFAVTNDVGTVPIGGDSQYFRLQAP